AVGGERDVGRVQLLAIPQLAGHLLVLLVERLAVVRELAATDLGGAAGPDLRELVRIRERLPRGRDEVRVAALEDRLGLREVADAARGHDRRLEAGLAHRAADRRRERDVATKRPALVGVDRRHALVAGAAGVRVRRPAD